MATNYERLIQCTKKELSYFFDSLVHKPASAYVDWDLWLSSEDPEAPYIGEEAFFLDGEEELKCRFLEESEINGEKHRTFYCVLPKGEVRKESIPAHLVRLATEEEYPEEDPLRKLINESVNEYTTEQDYSSYIFANPGTTIEKTASIPKPVVEETEEEVVLTPEPQLDEEIIEEEVIEDEEILPPVEAEDTTVSEEIIEVEDEEPLIEEVIETAEVEPIIEENSELEIEDIIETENPSIEDTAEIVVEDIMAIDDKPLPSIEVSEAEEYTNKIEGLLESLPTPEENNQDETIVLDDLSSLTNDEALETATISLESEIPENTVEETVVLDTINDMDLPHPEETLEKDDETIVISNLDELKSLENSPLQDEEVEVTLEEDSSFEKTDEYDLEKELAAFENTLSELESVVNDPGSNSELANSHAINTASIIQEYEEETDVELHDLLDDIKSRSTLFDPENPEDRELPTIAFMAMNPHDEDE